MYRQLTPTLTSNFQIPGHPSEGGWFTDSGHTGICPTMRGLEGVKVQQESGCVAIGNHVIHHHGNVRPIHLIIVRVQPLDGGRKVRGHCTGEGVLSSGRERVGRSSDVHSVSQFYRGRCDKCTCPLILYRAQNNDTTWRVKCQIKSDFDW